MQKPITAIRRYPLHTNDTLQGWDSADELILAHVRSLDLAHKKILIMNDHFGALSCGLSDLDCTTYTDSFVSDTAIRMNSEQTIVPLHDLEQLSGVFDYVVIQIPKNMSFFEDLLCHLTHHLHAGSKVICGAMVKHLAPTSFDLLNKYIGTTTTSLAQKKARLIFAGFEKEKVTSPYPQSVKIEMFEKPFINHSNLFSRDKLDIGTRFFLQHIPSGPFLKILDLGCANGIVGIKAKVQNPAASIIFSDESFMAIKSAETNYRQYFEDDARFFWTNCFEGKSDEALDLVLCNPPFHQQNTIGDFIAWQMFQDAFESLKKAGILRIVGNSHLGYQIKMKKIFGNSRIVETNQKFMICDSLR